MATATGAQTVVAVEYRIGAGPRRMGLVTLIADYSTTADIPKILAIPAGRIADEVTVYGVWHAPTCEWYAKCDKPTAGGLQHPVLGVVPICQSCARKHDVQDKVEALFLTRTWAYED